MKKSLLAILVLLSFSTFAQSVSVSYKCGAPLDNSNIIAGTNGEITKIKSLEIPSTQDPENYQVILKVDGIKNRSAVTSESTLKYSLKEMKTGTLLELKNDEANDYDFDAIFLEFGDLAVVTAGPIPEGTFDQKISVVLIKSNTKNPFPMTVRKLDFNCKTTVKYE